MTGTGVTCATSHVLATKPLASTVLPMIGGLLPTGVEDGVPEAGVSHPSANGGTSVGEGNVTGPSTNFHWTLGIRPSAFLATHLKAAGVRSML